jgi:regulator of sigma E protease
MATNIATNIVAVILVLGFLIFAHESGHFLMAKLFKVRVLVFSLGFGKRLFGFRRGDTDYRVSLVPLGGYVKMAGDLPEENQKEDSSEFLSKPKWQRFLILLAGPAVNILIAILFVAGINMVGTEQLLIKPIIGEVTPGKAAAKAGLQVGDQIVRIGSEPINDFDDLRLTVTMHSGTPLHVEYLRNGKLQNTTLTPDREQSDYGPVGRAGLKPMLEPLIGSVRPKSPAALAGLRAGDRIVGANGKPITQLAQFGSILDEVKGGAVKIDVQRGTSIIPMTLPAVGPKDADGYRGLVPPTIIHKLPLGPALRDSVAQNWKMLRYVFTAIGRIFKTEGSVKELSGPISIARISGEMMRRGWLEMVALIAMISLQLGVMNLLPVPMLDGGNIMILLVEGIARRDLSLMVKERIQQAGFVALALLMLVVIYNDVISNVLRVVRKA